MMQNNIQGNFPKNAMFGHAYVMDQKLNKIYSPEEALKKGTTFPELFSPYSPGDSMKEIEFLKNYHKGGMDHNGK